MNAEAKPITHNLTMDFSEEQAMVLEQARQFCGEKSPIPSVRNLLDSVSGFDAAVWEEQVQLGWMGLAIPEAYGGLGLGISCSVPVAEAMGKNLLTTPFIASTLAAQAILRGGDEWQREQWLPGLATGTVASLALLDDGDWGGSLCEAEVVRRNDEYILSGQKWFVAHGATAEFFVVSARCEGSTVLAVVSAEQVTKNESQVLIDETQRAAKISFDQVNLSSSAILSQADTDGLLADLCLLGALLTAAEAAGSAIACLETVVEYLNIRKQFGRLIGSYQALKHPTVESLNAVDSARSHIYHAAGLLGSDALDNDAEIACRMAKVLATDAICYAGDRAIQFHGGMGFTYECNAQLYLRRAQWSQQYYGDSRHHRTRLARILLDNSE